jgi:hypothetical protein
VLVPAPPPTFTLAPGLRLGPRGTAALDEAASLMTGVVATFTVVRVDERPEHVRLLIETWAGSVLVVVTPEAKATDGTPDPTFRSGVRSAR